MVAVSLIDDWRGVHPIHRLAVHLAAATLLAVPLAGGLPDLDALPAAWLAGAVIAVFIVWCANLYNFMDGTDGLAGAMGVFGFGAYGIAAVVAGSPAASYFSVAAAALAFLVVNLPPARTFMGDVGAVPLGFLAAGFGLAGWESGAWPGWFPLLVFLPFLGDASLTLAKRMHRRERVWEAHKEHYYQRVHQLGAGHRGTLALFGTLMIGTVASALATLAIRPEFGWGVLGAWCVGLAAVFAGIDYHWRHRARLSR
jgi:UDP-N-acetylmuramyl pentapeptide phosphotransferase/UDP-N-acetylglucosamine-1-phosphate transferase